MVFAPATVRADEARRLVLARIVLEKSSDFVQERQTIENLSALAQSYISMPYFVYILECKDKSLYVGCTNNLERRLKEHNESKWGAHYTKIRRPVKLKY